MEIGLAGQNPFGAITDAQLMIRSHTTCIQTSMTITQITVVPLGLRPYPTHWNVNFVLRDKRRLSCHVWLDYDLKTEDACGDAHGWKWVLLGTFYERPFGLLLHQANGSKWCRVGIFDSREYASEAHGRHWPMKLQDFTELSDVDTVIII